MFDHVDGGDGVEHFIFHLRLSPGEVGSVNLMRNTGILSFEGKGQFRDQFNSMDIPAMRKGRRQQESLVTANIQKRWIGYPFRPYREHLIEDAVRAFHGLVKVPGARKA